MQIRVAMNSSGAIIIPNDFLNAFRLKAGDQVIFEAIGDGILIRPTSDLEIYTEERIAEFSEDEEELGFDR